MTTSISTPTITYETAARAVACVMDAAAAAGVNAVATVVDPSIIIVALGKADGAPPHSLETSRRKAITAASTRKPSGAMVPALAVALEHGTGGLLTSIHGGFPIVFDGVHIGGLGVAGGTPQQDAEIALVALAALGANTEGFQA